MDNRLYVLGTALFLTALIVSGCGLGTVEPTPGVTDTPEPSAGEEEVPQEVRDALNAALAFVRAEYGDQAPAEGLDWAAEHAGPEDLVGSSAYRFTAGNWEVVISYPIVAPENVIYQVVVANAAADFRWEGEVDAQGRVTESGGEVHGSIDVEGVRVRQGERVSFSGRSTLPDGACLLTQLSADGERVAWWPEATCVTVEDGEWTAVVPLGEGGAPEELDTAVQYTLRVWYREDPAIDAVMSFDLAGPPPPAEEGEPVEGWVGRIVKLPPGNQFGQYFEREDGERFDIGAVTDTVREQIRDAAWRGAQIQVWGTMMTGVPAYAARHIEVDRIEFLSEAAEEPWNLTPFATTSASSHLPTDSGGQYQSWLATDGTVETAWAEGVDGPGIGEWITLTFPDTVEVHSVRVDVGYDRDADIFYKNNRIKRATLVFSNGEEVEVSFDDERGLQEVSLVSASGAPIETTYVKVVIDEVFSGSEYDDTCLSEIEVWGTTQ